MIHDESEIEEINGDENEGKDGIELAPEDVVTLLELIDMHNEVLQEMVHLPQNLRTVYYFKESFAAKLCLYKKITAKGLVDMYTNMMDYKVGDEMKVAKVVKKIENDSAKEDTLIMMKKVTVDVSDVLQEKTKAEETAAIKPDSTHDEQSKIGEEQNKNKVNGGEDETGKKTCSETEIKENGSTEKRDTINKENEIKNDEGKNEEITQTEGQNNVGSGDGQTGLADVETDLEKDKGVTHDDKTSGEGGEGDGQTCLTDVHIEKSAGNIEDKAGEGDGQSIKDGDEEKKGVKLDEDKNEVKDIKETNGSNDTKEGEKKEGEKKEVGDEDKKDENSEEKEEETAIEENNEKVKDDFTKKDDDDDEGGKTSCDKTGTEGTLVIDEKAENQTQETETEEHNVKGNENENENQDESEEDESSSEGDSLGSTEESEGSGDGQTGSTEESEGTNGKTDDDEPCYNGR